MPQAESAAVDGGVSADFDRDLVRVKLPFRLRQFTSGNRSIKNKVVIGPGLLYHLTGEGKRVLGGQKRAPSSGPHPDGSAYLLEFSYFRVEIVCGVRCLYMLVVGTAVKHDIAVGDNLAGVGVVIDRISVQHICSIMDLGVAAKPVYRAVLFLALGGTNRDCLLGSRSARYQSGRRR